MKATETGVAKAFSMSVIVSRFTRVVIILDFKGIVMLNAVWTLLSAVTLMSGTGYWLMSWTVAVSEYLSKDACVNYSYFLLPWHLLMLFRRQPLCPACFKKIMRINDDDHDDVVHPTTTSSWSWVDNIKTWTGLSSRCRVSQNDRYDTIRYEMLF